jgi:hypothetical protein
MILDNMKNVIDIHNNYKLVEKDTWRNRLTYKGNNGKLPKHIITIVNFNKETNAFNNIGSFYNINEFWNEVNKLADEYVNWVRLKNKYNIKEFTNIHNFFVGTIGELFFYYLFEEVRCLIAPNINNEYYRYDFSYVSPTLNGVRDGGVDFTAIVNDIPSVIQVKFWNPNNKKGMKLDIIQKAYAEGISNGIIDKDIPNNIFICWLGNESTIYNCVKDNFKQYKKNVVAIGKNTLDRSINNRNEVFWDKLKTFLQDFFV